MPRTSLKEVSECLHARYRSEPWFIRAQPEPNQAVLIVKPSCPFLSHRPVLDRDVVVRVAGVEPEPKAAAPTPPRPRMKPGPKPGTKRAPRPFTTTAARAVEQILSDRAMIVAARDERVNILANRQRNHPDGMGYMVSHAILLKLRGQLHAEVEELRFGFTRHWVLRLASGRILDATADQFNHLLPAEQQLPPIYLGDMPEAFRAWMPTERTG